MSYLIAIIPSLLKKVPSDYYMATCFLHFKSLNVGNIIFPRGIQHQFSYISQWKKYFNAGKTSFKNNIQN